MLIGTIALVVLLAAGALIAVLNAWNLPPFVATVERTDNAYVRGLTMSVAPQVSGYVVAVEVRDYEQCTPARCWRTSTTASTGRASRRHAPA